MQQLTCLIFGVGCSRAPATCWDNPRPSFGVIITTGTGLFLPFATQPAPVSRQPLQWYD
ncbi:hypothetical protein [Chloroflexus islandicus]|uniref:hypothetical protein n=1 Tax=Chloroflexus islandicus TaxID=1707952 RepID=UPI0012E7B6F3|nr:hypothetical protein [Chloroflexus islandicus]